MKIICIAKHKGGVGATTLAHALSSIWAKELRVILWDFDPQCSASLAAVCEGYKFTGYDLLTGACGIGDAICSALPVYGSNLKVIPASNLLARLDTETAARFDRGSLVTDVVADLHADAADILIMDTPPAQGSVLSIGPLAAADYALLPCSCDDASLQQVPRLQQTVEMVQKKLRPELKWLPIVANLYTQRQVMDEGVLAALREQYKIFHTVIPKRTAIREDMANRVPATNPELHKLAAEILEAIA